MPFWRAKSRKKKQRALTLKHPDKLSLLFDMAVESAI